MSEHFQYDQNQKRSIIVLLAKMADVDNKIASIESHYIKDVARRMELSDEELEDTLRHPDKYNFKPPIEERERMSILYYMLFLMRVDGKIEPKEEELCYKLGLRLGIQPGLIRDLIAVMKSYLNKDVPPEAMLEQIRKYLN